MPEPTGRTAAFFDLDGTLISGSSNIPLAMAAFRQGKMSPIQLFIDLRHNLSFLFNGATDERSAEVRDRILAAVAGHRVEEVTGLGDEFMDSLLAQVRPEMQAILDEHAAAGHDRVVISASPTEIVSRLARELGLEYGIGTTSEAVDGVYTGRLSGPFCYKEGKAEVLRQVAAERGYDLAVSYAYTDSVSDLPMLQAVGVPVAVGPDSELRLLAESQDWRIVETGGARGGLSVPSPAQLVQSALQLPARSLRFGGWLATATVNQTRATLDATHAWDSGR